MLQATLEHQRSTRTTPKPKVVPSTCWRAEWLWESVTNVGRLVSERGGARRGPFG